MAKVSPYHTNSTEYPPEHRNVHHDHDNCPDGKRIKPEHRVSWTGNKPRCKECIKLFSGFNFSCAVEFPDGSSGDVRQTRIQRDDPNSQQGMTFFVEVAPQERKAVEGRLHLVSSSLSTLDACPGDTRADKSACVTNTLIDWVKKHGVERDFALEVTVDYVDGQSCRVSLSLQ